MRKTDIMTDKLSLSRRSFLKSLSLFFAGITINQDVWAKENQKYKLTDFQSVADGDDITGILAQLLTKVSSTGGILELPSGTFTISKPLALIVNKNVTIQGNKTRLIFQNISGYAFTISGVKQNVTSSKSYQLYSTNNLIVRDKTKYRNLVISENNYTFQVVNLNLKQLDNYTFALSSQQKFFSPAMVGRNLICSENLGVTFYITKFIDANNVLVIPGNNQSRDLDLSTMTHWTIADLWCKSRGYYVKGEIIPINAKGNYKLVDNYIASNSNKYVFYSGQFVLQNVDIATSDCKYGIKIINLDTALFNNIKISGFIDNSVCVYQSINITIQQTTINGGVSQQASNYTCLIDSSQNVYIKNSNISGGFHGLSHGGTFPCRSLHIQQVKINNTTNWGLDFHGNCSGIIIDNCSANNGAYIGGIDCTISSSSFITSDKDRAALVLGPERNSNYYKIMNNQIANQIGNAIAVSSQYTINFIKQVTISNNQITAGQYGVIVQSYPYGNSPALNIFNIKNNKWSVSKGNYKLIDNHTKFQIS